MSNPLVTILIPTYNRVEMLMSRSLPAALGQTYKNIEILIIGDGTDQATVNAMSQVDDPRVFFTNLPASTYPPLGSKARWQVMGTVPLNWGIDHAKGEWLTMSGDDDIMMPRYVETLLDAAIEQDVDYLYARVETIIDGRFQGIIGEWPPQIGKMGNGIWKASLGFKYDPNSWERNQPCDWDLVDRMLKAGVKFGFTPKVVYQYFPSGLQSINKAGEHYYVHEGVVYKADAHS